MAFIPRCNLLVIAILLTSLSNFRLLYKPKWITQSFTLLLTNNAMDSTCSSIFQPLYRPASRGTCLTPKKALSAHPKSLFQSPFFIVHSQSGQVVHHWIPTADEPTLHPPRNRLPVRGTNYCRRHWNLPQYPRRHSHGTIPSLATNQTFNWCGRWPAGSPLVIDEHCTWHLQACPPLIPGPPWSSTLKASYQSLTSISPLIFSAACCRPCPTFLLKFNSWINFFKVWQLSWT